MSHLRLYLPLSTLLVGLLSFTPGWGEETPTLVSEARTLVGADQGIYVESSDERVLLAQAAAQPVHPASVSKLATTLALLLKFGPEFRFTTTFTASGRIHNETLDGDLWVASDGDPYFVDENAILVTARLNELGVRRVSGNLIARGALIFNWQDDPGAEHLRRAMTGQVAPEAWGTVRDLRSVPGAPSASVPRLPRIEFGNSAAHSISRSAQPDLVRPLVIHRSEPLLLIAKALNDYSNNIFNLLADSAGGASAVEEVARSVVPQEMRAEIVLGDGAGTDPRNRLSPRAAVKLLRALDEALRKTHHELVEILPVAGIDDGTLKSRLNAPGESGRVVGKTGTFGDYGASALVGAIATSDLGTVYFAILNHGIEVREAKRRQDQFVRVLLAHLHSRPWNYQADLRPEVARVEASAALP